jgi:radical SAM superfamily enzyme YgiQ (UPF0313 family)
MRAVLISTYEMGRQPFGLASPAAWLRAAGWEVDCADVAKAPLDDDVVIAANLIGFYLPMHTATRLAAPLIARVRRLNPAARLCAYGIYARLNDDWLRSLGVDAIFGGEFEEDLTRYATGRAAVDYHGPAGEGRHERGVPPVPRLRFLVPDRSGLPPLDRYAKLQGADGPLSLVGYTEASRGCRHLCRHCPIVPVYDGQFRVVQPDVVLADIAGQVGAGAGHITFGDPDFFNGPSHAMRIVEGLHAAHPSVTYDVTIKIEHLLRHRKLLPRLRDTGCLFITSAVEALDDGVLARLEKGHTRRDFVDAVALCRDLDVTLVPTFVAFHPWITLAGYHHLLETIAELDLIDHVAPIQLAIRLLIPQGSRLLELEEVRRMAGPFDASTLTHRWSHADPRVDQLQQQVSTLVGVRSNGGRRELFEQVSALARSYMGLELVDRGQMRAGADPLDATSTSPVRERSTVPYLNEPWYC